MLELLSTPEIRETLTIVVQATLVLVLLVLPWLRRR